MSSCSARHAAGDFKDDAPPRVDETRPWALIADDAPTCRQVLVVAMQRLGYRTRCCADGRHARACLGAAAPRFALALLDLHMPHGGAELILQKLRHRPGPLPLIIASSAAPNDKTRRRLSRLGCHAMLEKPFSLAKLYALLTPQLPLLRTAQACPAVGGDAAILTPLRRLLRDELEQFETALTTPPASYSWPALCHRLQGACLLCGADALAARFSALSSRTQLDPLALDTLALRQLIRATCAQLRQAEQQRCSAAQYPAANPAGRRRSLAPCSRPVPGSIRIASSAPQDCIS